MPASFSNQLYQGWRHAISRDFTTDDDEPFPYAENGKQQWGDEVTKISLNGVQPHNGCVSHDGKRLAMAVDQDIYIVETETGGSLHILKGHISRISALAFQPHNPDILVSSAEDDHANSLRGVDPVIIVWDISKTSDDHYRTLWHDGLDKAAAAAAEAAGANLRDGNITLTTEEIQELKETFKPGITRMVRQSLTTNNIRINGRLQTRFQSHVFNPSGSMMAYLPGKRPQEDWTITACSTVDFASNLIMFHGHKDNITWTGWNNDETLFASVSWDQTIRIWNAATGQQKYCFVTGFQNWTGAFSQDSKYFAATSGKGGVYIYSLLDGSIHWEYKDEQTLSWVRAAAWHPNSKLLAIGGRQNGALLLLDIYLKKVIQNRMLSTDKSMSVDKKISSHISRFLEVNEIQFFDHGNKIAFWTRIDCSLEVYDLSKQVKWRFARSDTEDRPGNDVGLASRGGGGMIIWESESNNETLLASIDLDSVRIWDLKP